MKWILLITKLPTAISPPKLSIHFATPWTDEEEVERQKEMYRLGDAIIDTSFITNSREPDWSGAMGFLYKGEYIRVFPHEYKVLSVKTMRDFVFGVKGEDIPSHELVPNNEADLLLYRTTLETSLQQIYDAALIDGCTPEMAHMVAMQMPIEDEGFEFPNVGWYRPKKEFAEVFCTESEMSE